ncbi:response regulator [Pseudomonas sp. ML96]|uniref:response regulator n=1 Tax=Pseudomonadaceae TaxID=135621 RepID=UPI000689EB8B|nr:response regulator [Pseudomonas sp. ML96]
MNASSNQVRVLCIEDEQTLLTDLQEELCAAGYEVWAASSVEQALAHLQEFTPDLVLCDVMLGNDDQPDGYFMHQYIRQKRPDLAAKPFIFLTALGQRADLLQAKRQGVDDYLVKPVDYDLLLATISARLDQVGRVRNLGQESLIDRMRDVLAQLPGAVLLCDESLMLLYANHKAQTLMQENGLWQVNAGGRLLWPEASPAAVQRLQQNICKLTVAPAGTRLVQTLEMRHVGDNVLVSMLRLDSSDQPLFALFICSAQSRPVPEFETLRMLFGLTRTEARVAQLLAQGRRSDEVAGDLGVTNTTVAFHLRNLFQKTGATRQSDLVALILAAGWALPDLADSKR